MIIKQDYANALTDIPTQMLIAPVLPKMVSDRAYAVGEQFIVNNVLYKITRAVSAADVPLVVGSNCEVSDTISQQIKGINDSIIFETQTVSTSGLGFDGTKKETKVTIPTLKSGYKPFILNVQPNVYSATNYLYYYGDINGSGLFYIEHNLLATCTQIYVSIAWVKNWFDK